MKNLDNTKLTLLIFSRNDFDKIKPLITEINQEVDYIILIDSSDESLHQELINWSKEVYDNKITVFYVVPLGYPDMLRPYAFSKCPTDWILLIDTDERLSQSLKMNIREIVNSDEADVYGLWRHPVINEAKGITSIRTIQIRLFNKHYVEERGIIHELPIISGRFKMLGNDCYIIHLTPTKDITEYEYSKITIFNRYSFGSISKNMKKILAIFHFGIKLKDDKELTNFDYFFYFLIKEIYSSLHTKDFKRFITSTGPALKQVNMIESFKKAPDNADNFTISKIIRKIGIVKFLELDKAETIEKLNILYTDKIKGSDLLILLLKSRYKSMTEQEIKTIL
jgi:hypothetical protein